MKNFKILRPHKTLEDYKEENKKLNEIAIKALDELKKVAYENYVSLYLHKNIDDKYKDLSSPKTGDLVLEITSSPKRA